MPIFLNRSDFFQNLNPKPQKANISVQTDDS